VHFDRNRLSRLTITLPTSLLEEIDRRTGHRGRSRYVAEAVAHRVRRDALGNLIRETAGAGGEMTPEEVARWIDELRRETAD
jgi:metal-responsive CopG/Arc/MetJ family transcriptional regulator